MRALPTHLFGQGAGTINFCRMLGGAFGNLNLITVYLERRTQLHAEMLRGHSWMAAAPRWRPAACWRTLCPRAARRR